MSVNLNLKNIIDTLIFIKNADEIVTLDSEINMLNLKILLNNIAIIANSAEIVRLDSRITLGYAFTSLSLLGLAYSVAAEDKENPTRSKIAHGLMIGSIAAGVFSLYLSFRY